MNTSTVKKPTNATYIGIALLCFAALLFLVVWYVNSSRGQVPVIFSPKEVLENTWTNYKADYLEAGSNRTLDKQQNNLTTSEGESYTMLRAVWMDDKATFDASLKWTQDILKHKNDNLHSWVFGEQSPGHYAVLTSKGGQNSATDAETDMAMSLLFAYGRWNDQSYMDQAQALIADIWKNEVVMINGKPVLVANDVEHLSTGNVMVNPSYFAPYEYRMFAAVDSKHDWQGVVDSSYTILNQSIASPLDKGASANIPPDWVQINRQTGAVEAAMAAPDQTTNYSYDALRVPWRLALDGQWYGDPRDKQILDSLNFFSKQWEADKSISVTYMHDGTLVGDETEVPALYGGLIGYFMISDQKNAADVYEHKLAVLYNPDMNAWRMPLGYYDDNWTWFGIGLYQHLLPNLTAAVPDASATVTN